MDTCRNVSEWTTHMKCESGTWMSVSRCHNSVESRSHFGKQGPAVSAEDRFCGQMPVPLSQSLSTSLEGLVAGMFSGVGSLSSSTNVPFARANATCSVRGVAWSSSGNIVCCAKMPSSSSSVDAVPKNASGGPFFAILKCLGWAHSNVSSPFC